ncbi:MAG TPA: lysylphosphatidylglycerol synthase domain-containing protein, partial [Gemmatimonadaceae bacterium]|nr:lysylphosphatidylglycerol synthase domain-containing protein [Gemmatimonadaceae bacterium]
MNRRAWRVLQVVAVVAVLLYVGRRLSQQWGELATLPGTIRVDWVLVALSGGVVLVSYGVLIWTWQRTVRAWGEHISLADAARIWFVSNLGRYVPGKVWQIGAMGVMAQRVGVSPVAAVGSSLVISIINVITGVAVAMGCGAGSLGAPSWTVPLTAALAAGVIATPWLLPHAARAFSRVLRRDIPSPRLPPSAVWFGAAGCTVAWMLYGAAFRLLHVALLGPTGDLLRSTAAFTGSYILGFLALFAPGGIGVREGFLQDLLGRLGLASGADAWLVVLASRAWLT